MLAAPIDRMLWSVGARFGFSEAEIQGMSLSRLVFWYRGHVEMWKEESGKKSDT